MRTANISTSEIAIVSICFTAIPYNAARSAHSEQQLGFVFYAESHNIIMTL